MIAVDKLFIVGIGWWICSNDGKIDKSSEIIRDAKGIPISNKETNVFISYSSFIKGTQPQQGDKVECMYDLDGNNLCFKGSVKSFNGQTCTLNIESEHSEKGIKEICNKINTNNYI